MDPTLGPVHAPPDVDTARDAASFLPAGWRDDELYLPAAALCRTLASAVIPGLSRVSADALDDRIAIVGTAGSGKTYAAKGFVERLLETGARIAIVDPLGVCWGLRASADGTAPGYPVVVFGGRHADVPITAESGTALGRLIAAEALACVVDLSELGSNAARRRFMAAFAEALYEANKGPLHLPHTRRR